MVGDLSFFCNRLKQARLCSGLSQKALGIAAGFDEFSASARMNQYERGTHMPDHGTVKRIAKVLNVPTLYLYAEDDLDAELLLAIHKLDISEKQLVLKHVKAISNDFEQ